MTREQAKSFIQNHLITSLGELAHGYVCYQSTADLMVDLLSDEIQKLKKELEALQKPKTCDGCEYNEYNYLHKCENCSRKIRKDYYEPKAELEALQKPKTCESCVNYMGNKESFTFFNCHLLKKHVAKDFYCEYYEPEETE